MVMGMCVKEKASTCSGVAHQCVCVCVRVCHQVHEHVCVHERECMVQVHAYGHVCMCVWAHM